MGSSLQKAVQNYQTPQCDLHAGYKVDFICLDPRSQHKFKAGCLKCFQELGSEIDVNSTEDIKQLIASTMKLVKGQQKAERSNLNKPVENWLEKADAKNILALRDRYLILAQKIQELAMSIQEYAEFKYNNQNYKYRISMQLRQIIDGIVSNNTSQSLKQGMGKFEQYVDIDWSNKTVVLKEQSQHEDERFFLDQMGAYHQELDNKIQETRQYILNQKDFDDTSKIIDVTTTNRTVIDTRQLEAQQIQSQIKDLVIVSSNKSPYRITANNQAMRFQKSDVKDSNFLEEIEHETCFQGDPNKEIQLIVSKFAMEDSQHTCYVQIQHIDKFVKGSDEIFGYLNVGILKNQEQYLKAFPEFNNGCNICLFRNGPSPDISRLSGTTMAKEIEEYDIVKLNLDFIEGKFRIFSPSNKVIYQCNYDPAYIRNHSWRFCIIFFQSAHKIKILSKEAAEREESLKVKKLERYFKNNAQNSQSYGIQRHYDTVSYSTYDNNINTSIPRTPNRQTTDYYSTYKDY